MAIVASRQHGVVSTAQLIAAGLTRAAIRVRVRTGRLHRVHRGVYAVGHPGLTRDGRLMAAVLAGGPGAVLSHWAAAAHAGLLRWDERRDIDITVLHRGGRDRPGIRVHRPRRLDPRDTTRIRGVPTTTPARTLLEIAPRLSDDRLKRLTRKAQAEGLASTRQIAEMLDRAKGRPASHRLRALIATGTAPTASSDEDVVLDLVLAAGFEHPDVNKPLQIATATYYPDLRWPAQRLILEVDSRWHDGRLAHELDAVRQADLEAAGERVLRTTSAQAAKHPRQLADRLRAAGAPYTDPQP